MPPAAKRARAGDDSAGEGTRSSADDDASSGRPPSAMTPSRDHLDAHPTPTLRSVDLGAERRCFLCAFSDETLADESLFVECVGPIAKVTRMWRAGADTTDADALARDCCLLLRGLLREFLHDAAPGAESPAAPELAGDSAAAAPRPTLDDVTPEAVKHHFTVCVATPEARLNTLKNSFRANWLRWEAPAPAACTAGIQRRGARGRTRGQRTCC